MNQLMQDEKQSDGEPSPANSDPVQDGISPPLSSPVAIVGLAFRFPGDLGNEADFWDALKQKRDLVTQIPADRWAIHEFQHEKRSEPGRSVTFSAGVLSRIDEFDAAFFGVSPREAAVLDPQQRLLLELAWEAMENGGILPSSIAGSNCAVYVGISGFDYSMRGLDDLAVVTPHSMTGNTLSIAANRLSYVFNLQGPSLAIDTACSSSLVALHHACTALSTGEASTALVGGVNLLLHPQPFIGFTKAAMLSANGRCKSFDATGDGYVRSEGGAVLLLKPLKRALAEGNDIQGIILASGVNADGARKTGITIPSSEGQAELMRSVLARSGLLSTEVDFIEAHGTGTAVGDPIETLAIGRVYGQGRPTPLPIGSVKTNLGHLESASGMAGLVKALLALKNHALPPSIHLETPNPRIDFQALNLDPVTDYRVLAKRDDKPLVAGVNSFGFGGANAHVLLQAFTPRLPVVKKSQIKDMPPLFLSARSEPALRALAQRYADLLDQETTQNFYDLAYSAAFQREWLEKRLALYPDPSESVANVLRRYAQGDTPAQVFQEDTLPQSGGVAFVYSGNGAQWVGMGRKLLAESPRFTEILREIDEIMSPLVGFSSIVALQADESVAKLDDTTVAQPLLFAIQVAITTLLKEQGIEPMAVTGHSVGEIAAAWAAGALDLPQAIHVLSARSQAQGLTRGKGRMAVVGLPAVAIEKVIAELPEDFVVEIAGINSPTNVTLSGDLAGLLHIQRLVKPKGIFFRLLELDYAFHSRQMDFIEGELTNKLASFKPTSLKKAIFVSTVTGNVLNGISLDSHYWWRNIREPVRFAEAITKLAELGCRLFVEIGPHAILQRYLGECLAGAGIHGRVIPTLRRNDDGKQRIIEAAFRIHLLADRPQFHSYFLHAARRVRLPNYPWQRERHWHPRTSEALQCIERRRVHPLLGWPLPEVEGAWENTLDPVVLPWLGDHKVGGATVFPGAAYSEMALAAARVWLGGEHVTIEELDIIAPLVFDGEHGRTLRFFLNPRDNSFQIKSRQRLSNDDWTLHATGRLLESASSLAVSRIPALAVPSKQFDRETHYRFATLLGLDYGPAFQGLGKVFLDSHTLEAPLALPQSLDHRDYLLHPAVLDICFQSLLNFFAEEIDAGQGIPLLPIRVGRLERWGGKPITRLRASLIRRGPRSVLADFELLDEENNLIAQAIGCRFRAAQLKRHSQQKIPNWSLIPQLRPHPIDGKTTSLPSISHLALQARTALAACKTERGIWFKETLPLTEALTLSFLHETFQQLAQKNPSDWQQTCVGPQATPYGRWLADLMIKEGRFKRDGDRWIVTMDDELPSADALWQTLLRDSPACLPHLTLLGRVGQRLAGLLCGTLDGGELSQALRRSLVAETLYNEDPAYQGIAVALDSLLRHLVSKKPPSSRLRILEIPAGPSELPKSLITELSADHFDYVLALPNEAMQERQATEYRDHPSVVVATLDTSNWKLTAEKPLPDVFDVVILRHVLHRTTSLHGALVQIRRWLAAGGGLLLAERHPDWSANFVEGIDPNWWHEENSSVPTSSLLPPETWQRLLKEAGFVDGEVFTEPAAEGLAEGAYLLLAKRSLEESVTQSHLAAASWLLLVDKTSAPLADHLGSRLESQGQQVTIAAQIDPSRGVDHIVYLLGWGDPPDEATNGVVGLLQRVQALISAPQKPPRLWLVTQGGALVSGLPTELPPNPAQSALWGFGRVVMNEYPSLSCTLIDLVMDRVGDIASAGGLSRLENELLHPDGASEIVLSAEARHCIVMTERTELSSQEQQPRFRLDFLVPGQLRNLVWLPGSQLPLQDNEIEVHTRATGLNFRDVMYLMGLLPDEAVENGFAGASLGLEFSGVVSRVGARVKDLLPGDAVMGFGSSCFASHVVTRADAVAPMLEGWTFAAAATVPTVFFTVYYALKHLADLQPGERLLIHGAAGGVGIAAIQLARYLGAEIYATAGSDEKRDFVTLLGADHVFDSRRLAFAEDILGITAGEGVDVVLNSLAGEAMRRSLSVLKPFGRFLELGKRDFFENTALGLRPFKNNISYFGIDADQLLTGRPKLAARLFREVMALFREQALAPLPHRIFTTDQIVEAFRVMQQARHIGKLVVSLENARPAITLPSQPPTPVSFKRETTWIVTGGLSGFGLESARWLAARGVGHLVLVGRRGLKTPGAREVIEAFKAQGVVVQAHACDITQPVAVATLIEHTQKTLPPLKGVLHAAAVFDDRLLANLDPESIETVLNAKLLGAWHLHQKTFDIPLDHFIVYSSVTTAIGNPGQANYVAANAGLEGLTAMRRQLGLPATCIAWGPIGDAGYLVRNESVKDGLEQRLGKPPLTATDALTQLDRALHDTTGFIMPANFDWGVLARLLPSASSNRFAILNRNRRDSAPAGEVIDIRALIAGKTAEEGAAIVGEQVRQEVARILCISPDRIEANRSLHDLGMDSLMAVELALGLEQRFAIQLPVMALNDSPTISNVATRIIEKLISVEPGTEEAQTAAMVVGLARQHGEQLTKEEIQLLNSEARRLAKTGTKLTP